MFSRSVDGERGQRLAFWSATFVRSCCRATYLVKWPGIAEAALKHFIHCPLCLFLITITRGIGHDAEHRPALDALLVLQLEAVVAADELAAKVAVSAEARCANLGAGMVAEVGPVDEEAAVVEPVHHFVRDRVFKVRFRVDAVRADQDRRIAGRFRGQRGGEATGY